MSAGKFCTVLQNRQIAKDIFQLNVAFENGKKEDCLPGRFIHMRIPDRPDLILRRPFGINAYDEKKGTLSIVYHVVGKGTEQLCALESGKTVDILGPLGNGFALQDSHKRIFLVGGGLGVAPIRYIPQYYQDRDFAAFIGFQSADCAYQVEDFQDSCSDVIVTSDDGSLGQCGLCTTPMMQAIENNPPDVILACGPKPMFKAMQQLLGGYDIPVQVSLEERMGCGFGACAVCTCGISRDGRRYNKRVCMDGPVFHLSEVVFDD